MYIITLVLVSLPVIFVIMAMFNKGPIAYIVANHSPESRRGNHDTKAHSRFDGLTGIIFIIFVSTLIVGSDLSIIWLRNASMVAMFLPPAINLIYKHTGERFKKK